MREKLMGAVGLIGIGYVIAFFAGWWFPWTSIVVGVLLLLFTAFALFDAKTRKELGVAGVVGFVVFGFLLFRSGRAELSNNAAIEAEKIDRQIASVERMLAQGQFDDAIRLSVELESKATNAQATRLNQIKLSAEIEAKLRPGRIKEANELVAKLVSNARAKLANLNDVSEEAEKISAQAFAVPLATQFAAARDLANELVRRRVAVAQSLLDLERLDDAKEQIAAARKITGAVNFEDTQPLGTAIANRIIERTVSDVRPLIESNDFTTAEAKLRAVLNEPEATEREAVTALVKTIAEEREKVEKLASKKVANKAAEDQKPATANTHRRKVTKEEFGDKWPLTVDEGEIECVDKTFRLFHHGGKTYALNGIARSHSKKHGWLEIQSIWKDNPELGDGFKVNIGPLLEAAGKLCEDNNQILGDRTIEAWTAAEILVTKRLKSPSTASYGGLFSGEIQDPRKCVKSLGNGEYQVKGWVDSQNTFGATVRTEFELTVKDHGDDNNWSLVGQPVMRQR